MAKLTPDEIERKHDLARQMDALGIDALADMLAKDQATADSRHAAVLALAQQLQQQSQAQQFSTEDVQRTIPDGS